MWECSGAFERGRGIPKEIKHSSRPQIQYQAIHEHSRFRSGWNVCSSRQPAMTPSQPRISASASHPRALSRTCYSYIVTNSFPRPMVEAVTHFYLTRASPLSQIILHTLASPYPHCPREALTISTFRTSPLYMFIALLPPDPVYPLAGEEAPGLTRVLCSATVDSPSRERGVIILQVKELKRIPYNRYDQHPVQAPPLTERPTP
jgi:hypothetical protein